MCVCDICEKYSPGPRKRHLNIQIYNSLYWMMALLTSVILRQREYTTKNNGVFCAGRAEMCRTNLKTGGQLVNWCVWDTRTMREPRGKGMSYVGGRYQKTGKEDSSACSCVYGCNGHLQSVVTIYINVFNKSYYLSRLRLLSPTYVWHKNRTMFLHCVVNLLYGFVQIL